jgi:hypothetical protein
MTELPSDTANLGPLRSDLVTGSADAGSSMRGHAAGDGDPSAIGRDDQTGDAARCPSWIIQPLPSGSLNDTNEL